jgi:hypothetical protein
LVEVLVNVGVTFFKLLFSVFSDLSLHHGLFISEKAVGSTEEALKSNDFLEETKLGISLLINMGFSLRLLLLLNGLLNG